jgi:hypothetical protein
VKKVALEDSETTTKAEEATAALRRGVERSRALISFYRRRLAILRDIGNSSAESRPIFRFGEEGRLRNGSAPRRQDD